MIKPKIFTTILVCLCVPTAGCGPPNSAKGPTVAKPTRPVGSPKSVAQKNSQGINHSPSNTINYHELEQIKRRNSLRASGVYRELLKTFPEDDRLRVGLAEALADMGKFDEASLLVNKISAESTLEIHRRQVEVLYLLEEDETAKAIGDQLVKQFPGHSTAYAVRAQSQLFTNRQAAKNDLQKAMELEPDNALKHRLMGELLVLEENFAAAEKQFDRAVELEDDFAAYVERGKLHAEMGNDDKAISNWENASHIFPASPKPYYLSGALYLKRREYEKAALEFGSYLDAHPPDPSYGWNRMATAFCESGIYNEALNCIEKAIEFDPEDWSHYNCKGASLVGLNRLGEAITFFDKGIELAPNEVVVYFNRGNCRFRNSNWSAALADYDRAIQLGSKHPEVFLARGRAKFQLEKFDAALLDITRSIEIKPTWEAYHHRAKVYDEIGRTPAAVADRQKEAELKPKSQQSQ